MGLVLLVRHGRTTANASGVLAGWTPGIRLDDTGIEQVIRVGEGLRHVRAARLVTSPLERCVQTAQLLRDTAWPQLPVEKDDGLAECRYGRWTGRALKELAEEPLWKVVQQQPSAAAFPAGESATGEPMEGESIAAMAARTVAAVRAIDTETTARHGEHAVSVVVSHGDPIKAVIADAAGTHLDAFQRYALSPASMSVVQYTPQRPFLVSSNVPHGGLAGLLPPSAKDDDSNDRTASAAGHQAGEAGDAAVGGGV